MTTLIDNVNQMSDCYKFVGCLMYNLGEMMNLNITKDEFIEMTDFINTDNNNNNNKQKNNDAYHESIYIVAFNRKHFCLCMFFFCVVLAILQIWFGFLSFFFFVFLVLLLLGRFMSET